VGFHCSCDGRNIRGRSRRGRRQSERLINITVSCENRLGKILMRYWAFGCMLAEL
jgi:hypothetical protein